MFRASYVKEARLLARNARKLLHRRRDLLEHASIGEAEAKIDKLEAATRSRDRAAIKEASDEVDNLFTRVTPQQEYASWRENCEVLLVAFVIAIGIRAYFVQPFMIPTGSMQPTLNGNIGYPLPADQPIPGFFTRVFETIAFGRSYVDVVSPIEDQIINILPQKRFVLMEYANIVCASGRIYQVHAPAASLRDLINRGRIAPGGFIAHGYVDAGDHVFVDKFTYHFRAPQRGDVFVFSTSGIEGIAMDDPNVTSQFYIKRLAGLPGDTLRIDAPRLFVNGEQAKGSGFERVQAAQDGYRGYSNHMFLFNYLNSPTDDVTIPEHKYFALGDNSYNSSDSRKWGWVPEQNVIGRGIFVYWPFTRHWSFVR